MQMRLGIVAVQGSAEPEAWGLRGSSWHGPREGGRLQLVLGACREAAVGLRPFLGCVGL